MSLQCSLPGEKMAFFLITALFFLPNAFYRSSQVLKVESYILYTSPMKKTAKLINESIKAPTEMQNLIHMKLESTGYIVIID